MKTILASVVVIGLALGGAAYYAIQRTVEPVVAVRTAKVQRGDLSRTIDVKGTVKLDQVEPQFIEDSTHIVCGRVDEEPNLNDSRRYYSNNLAGGLVAEKSGAAGIEVQPDGISPRTGCRQGVVNARDAANLDPKHAATARIRPSSILTHVW